MTKKNIQIPIRFSKFHSIDSCLSHLEDKVAKGFDSGFLTGMISIDLRKAFDTIDQKILIEKMKFLMLQNGLNVICLKECLVYT